MVNTPQATSDLQTIDTAPSTMLLKNTAAESVDICQIREYPTLSIGAMVQQYLAWEVLVGES